MLNNTDPVWIIVDAAGRLVTAVVTVGDSVTEDLASQALA